LESIGVGMILEIRCTVHNVVTTHIVLATMDLSFIVAAFSTTTTPSGNNATTGTIMKQHRPNATITTTPVMYLWLEWPIICTPDETIAEQ
jgi:hypothetical protein